MGKAERSFCGYEAEVNKFKLSNQWKPRLYMADGVRVPQVS